MGSSQPSQAARDIFTEPSNLEVVLAIVFTVSGTWIPLIALALVSAAIIRAFWVSRRPGTAMMLVGIALFWLLFAAYFLIYPSLIVMSQTALTASLAVFVPMIPVLIIAIGFLRLAWTLERRDHPE